MTTRTAYDAIFVGSGHNALVTAAYLAKAGWSVLVLERNARFGGWVCTEETTLPGFRHDLYASVIPLWLTSRVHMELGSELGSFGLRFVNTHLPTGVVMGDERTAVLSTSMDKNVEEFENLAQGDGEAWGRILELFAGAVPAIGQLFSSDLSTPHADALMREIFSLSDRNRCFALCIGIHDDFARASGEEIPFARHPCPSRLLAHACGEGARRGPQRTLDTAHPRNAASRGRPDCCGRRSGTGGRAGSDDRTPRRCLAG
jgi:hypothetical protein